MDKSDLILAAIERMYADIVVIKTDVSVLKTDVGVLRRHVESRVTWSRSRATSAD